MNYDEDELIERARVAYFKAGELDQPERGGEVRELDGVTYVILSNIRGILAVYVWNGTSLKRNKAWPPELDVM